MLKTTQNLVQRISIKIGSEISKIAKPIDSHLISKIDVSKKIEFPPVFIVGAPRTGSTLVYQVITNSFDVKYTSNFNASFYHSLYVGMLLEEYVLGHPPHNMFDSNYGMVKSLNGPNECGQFWYRWFPADRHFIAYHEYSKEELLGIRKTICAICKKFLKPLVFKNLNNGQRLQIIKKVLPESLIIFVRRDPVFAAQSILASRQDYYGDKNTWFSVKPKNIAELLKDDYPKQIVKQIFYIEKQIFEDLNLFPDCHHIIIKYEDFCKDTAKEIERLEYFFNKNKISVKKRESTELPNFKIDKEQLVSNEDFQLIQKESEKISWESGM